MIKNRALFLDRDGVINVDKAYVYKPEDFEWVPGVIPLMKRFQQAGYLLIVVTNQSGIARGYYSEAQFLALTEWMKTTLSEQGVELADVYYCPHHPTQGRGEYGIECDCRKPAPGMILQAIQKWNIDPESSVLIGDSWRDIEAGVAAGVTDLYYFLEQIPSSMPCESSLRNSRVSVASDLNYIRPNE